MTIGEWKTRLDLMNKRLFGRFDEVPAEATVNAKV